LEGELDNTTPGKVTGWMRFAGVNDRVTFNLKGDFHRDIRGAKIRFVGDGNMAGAEAAQRMDGLAIRQTGKVGDITAGLPPQDYVDYPYIEWYGDENGRVVLELEAKQISVIGTPIPAIESDPVSREQQAHNMGEFLTGVAQAMNVPEQNTICLTLPGQFPRTKHPGHQLMPDDVRKQLPPIYAQEKLGGKAIARVRYFTPDSNWTWYATEFDGEDTFFGLVDGQYRELGYFSLAELQTVHGPHGMPIERDLHWRPATLQEIAPEMFRDRTTGGE
jgi:hypothetical protein